MESAPPWSMSAEEQHALDEITAVMTASIRARAEGGERWVRPAHPRHHGCVRALFEVLAPPDPALRVGLFARPAAYEAWCRFSNAAFPSGDDRLPDLRGVAIKILGVTGAKLLSAPRLQHTQDIVLLSTESLFVRDLFDFRDLVRDASDGQIRRYFVSLRRRQLRLRELGIALQCLRRHTSPLTIPYSSVTPYRLGPTHCVKYRLVPRGDLPAATTRGRDRLRTAMVQQLSAQPAVFDLQLQVQADPVRQPLDDVRVVWDVPGQTVARLTIPSQTFDTPAQLQFGEDLAFSPWHTLPAHTPLGSINRGRGAAYAAMATLRRARNGVVPFEPRSTASLTDIVTDGPT